jgi:hypothetical protein
MQPDLFIHGATFDSGIPLDRADHIALGVQLSKVLSVLRDGQVHTVEEIHARVGGKFTSISANCRNLRKLKHGGYHVERVTLAKRHYAYRLVA